ncbi:putative membrane protein [Saonia flava]|uniref:Putative membrane protein n=1 Tax=Saonia flava TaxID=523696 RepID=A0A846QZL0_9FLAO|nr:2TM domain-containing protein [Saonia flava]NJB72092.1 putative membrane protein [Saonia flava]
MDFKNAEENRRYAKAKKRVKEVKGFYTHIIAYIVLIPIWIFINYMTYWDFKWFWFPVVGMGISIIVHAIKVYGYGKDWEERKMKELMEKDTL